MKALGISTLALIALCLAQAGPVRADDSAVTMTREQTFVVQVLVGGGKAAIGAAVVVRRDGDVLTLATAAHVMRAGGPIRILDTSRRDYYDVIDVRTFAIYDIALIRVRAQPQFSVEPVVTAPAVAGERVWIWGNPGDSFWHLSTGVVRDAQVQLPGKQGVPRITIACDDCAQGDSGAGVFDDHGRMIGILTAGWSDRGGKVLFVEVQPSAIVAEATAQ